MIELNSKENLEKIHITKAKLVLEMQKKIEETKLKVIKICLQENNLKIPNDLYSIKKIKIYLKEKLPELHYKNYLKLIQSINDTFNSTLLQLEKNSQIAFTKLMNSNLSNTIAKSLFITLNGRTLLTLAPTILTNNIKNSNYKNYYIVAAMKNKKTTKEKNISYELDNIISELEITLKEDKIIDTRFNQEIIQIIINFLSKSEIYYQYTGYRSLMMAVYNLSDEQKIDLINLIKLKKNISKELSEKINFIEKKINIVSKISNEIASNVNVINTNIKNYTLLSTWLSMKIEKTWLQGLINGLSEIGTSNMTLFTSGRKIKASENSIFFNGLGFEMGVATEPILSIISTIKDIMNKKIYIEKNDNYRKIDFELYNNDDKKEYELMINRLSKETTLEAIIIDITVGYFNDVGIKLKSIPTDISELTNLIKNIPSESQILAFKILDNINKVLLENHEKLQEDLKKIGKISGILILSGFPALSVYNILKTREFLKELSDKIFNVEIKNILPNQELQGSTFNIEKYRNIYQNIRYEILNKQSAVKTFANTNEKIDINIIANYINKLTIQERIELYQYLNTVIDYNKEYIIKIIKNYIKDNIVNSLN